MLPSGPTRAEQTAGVQLETQTRTTLAGLMQQFPEEATMRCCRDHCPQDGMAGSVIGCHSCRGGTRCPALIGSFIYQKMILAEAVCQSGKFRHFTGGRFRHTDP